MEEVVINTATRLKIDSLVDILIEKNYFGFKETAQDYVNAIYDFISSIPYQRKYRTKNSRYGAWYCRYKPNKNTTYYITFHLVEDRYFVLNIITNHTRHYPTYIKGV